MASLVSSTNLYDQFKPPERLVLLFEAMARADEAEVERIRRTCPRKTYVGPDDAFEDRYELALDISVVACGDLKSLVAQMRVLRWAMGWVKRAATLHHVNADMAFVDGVRCAEGFSQSPYFASRHGPNEASSEEGDTAPPRLKRRSKQGDEEEAPSCFGEDFSRRMATVEQRSEESTEMILEVLRRAQADLAEELNSLWSAYDAFCRSRIGMPPERLLEAFEYPGRQELAEALTRHKDVQTDAETTTMYQEALCRVWDRRFATNQ